MTEPIPHEADPRYVNGMCMADGHLAGLRRGLDMLHNIHDGAHVLHDLLGLPLGVEHDLALEHLEVQGEAFRRSLLGTLN